jgi:hypothetical protein
MAKVAKNHDPFWCCPCQQLQEGSRQLQSLLYNQLTSVSACLPYFTGLHWYHQSLPFIISISCNILAKVGQKTNHEPCFGTVHADTDSTRKAADNCTAGHVFAIQSFMDQTQPQTQV